RLTAFGCDRLDDRAGAICVEIADDQLAALRRDRPTRRSTDAAGASGDDDHTPRHAAAHRTTVESTRSAPRTYVRPQTSSSSAGNFVMMRQPVDVTTTSSSIRAADWPSVAGQYVSSAKTIP